MISNEHLHKVAPNNEFTEEEFNEPVEEAGRTLLGTSWNALLPGNSPEASRTGGHCLQIRGGGSDQNMHMGKCR